jgi:hypothetical protein
LTDIHARISFKEIQTTINFKAIMGMRLYKGNNDDGSGDDFLWTKSGKDFLIGQIEADDCDCGKGFQIILNYDKCKEDTKSKNCKVF